MAKLWLKEIKNRITFNTFVVGRFFKSVFSPWTKSMQYKLLQLPQSAFNEILNLILVKMIF
jgi:hypothetical protein